MGKTKMFDRHLTVLFLGVMLFIAASCSFLSSFQGDDDEKNTLTTVQISSLTVGKTAITLKVGAMDYVSVSIKPQDLQKSVTLSWTYDRSIIECDTSSNWGIVVKALAEGQTPLRCSYGGYEATCLVTVSGYEEGFETTTEPYIYSNTTILQTSPGISERVFVSLYGGDARDIDGFSWAVDSPSVASIQPTGQYCLITAKDSGYTRIKVTHPKAAYPYYMGVYVFADATNVTYITTSDNILTMNKDDAERSVSVSLVNGRDSSLDSSFRWEIVNQDSDTVPVKIQCNGNRAVVTPVASGSCTLRVTHPDASYPLDILCRVITVVKNVYIKPDNTVVYLNGETEQTVSSTLENIALGDYSPEDYEYRLEDYDAAEIVAYAGNQVILKGKSNGSTKLIISHPKAAYAREVLLIVTEQLKDAVDSSFYITTSQNYIKTKVGASTTAVNVMLKGGEEGDENGFVWEVSQNPLESGRDVVSLETSTGKVSVRAAKATYAFGNAYISPVSEGSAVIKIRHPKAYYDTEILVKVLNENALLDSPLYLSGSGIVKFLNSESYNYEVSLLGSNKAAGDENSIRWKSDSSALTVQPSGNQAVLTSNGTGNNISHIEISHPKVENPKSVLVLTADTQEELDKIKAFYSDKTYYSLNVGSSINLFANHVGFNTYDENGNVVEEFDFTLASWTSSDPTVASVEKSDQYPLNAIVRGNRTGTAKITVSYGSDASLTFTVTVYPEGVNISEIETTKYLTTSQNVVNLSKAGMTASVYVSAIGISPSSYSGIVWSVEDASVARVAANGNTATVTARGEGETVLTVSHPESENSLKIYVRVGSEYVLPEVSSVSYIKAPNLITLLTGDSSAKLTASLSNEVSGDSGGFRFAIDNEGVAKIAAKSSNGTAYIKPISVGSAEITIGNDRIASQKKVLVVVGDTKEQINEILARSVYLTTNSNVISLYEGDSAKVQVTAANLSTAGQQSIKWTSADESVATVIPNGKSATIVANGNGKTCVFVTYEGSLNSVTYYVFVGEEAIAEANGSGTPSGGGSSGSGSSPSGGSGSSGSPETSLIQINSVNVFTVTTGERDKLLSASLSNFSGDQDGFNFAVKDSGIARIASQSSNGTACIKPVAEGYTEITVSHKATDVIKKILVVVGKNEETVAELVAKPVYLTTPNNVVALEGKGKGSLVKVNAANMDSSEFSRVRWTCADESVASVMPNGLSATIMANGSGKTTVYATYEGSLNSVTYYVFVGEEAIAEASGSGTGSSGESGGGSGSSETGSGSGSSGESGTSPDITARAISISSVNVVSILTGEADKQVSASLSGYSGADTDGFSFSIRDDGIARIASQSSNGTAFVKPISEGYTEITVSHRATDVTKKIIVVVGKNETAIAQALGSLVYLTTTDNIVRLTEGGSGVAKVTAANLSTAGQQSIAWRSLDPSVATVINNGASATIIAKNPGICTVSAAHADSVNSVTFHVFVSASESDSGSSGSGGSGSSGSGSGSSGESGTSPEITARAISISSVNVVSILTGEADKQVSASLSGYSGADTDGFSFSIRDGGVARISSQSSNGIAYIKPVAEGYTEITVSHRATDVTKKILVVVGKTEADVSQTLESIVYLTTASNVIRLTEGETAVAKVTAANLNGAEQQNIVWRSVDSSVATVIGNGANATIMAKNPGICTVSAAYSGSVNSLTFHVFVSASESGAGSSGGSSGGGGSGGEGSSGSGSSGSGASPEIAARAVSIMSVNVVSLLTGDADRQVSAALSGYSGADTDGFCFAVKDSGIARISSQSSNGVAYIKPVAEGYTEITVSHKATDVTKKILVVVGKTEADASQALESIVYLTTASNVLFLSGIGTRGSFSVSANNLSSVSQESIRWTSSSSSVVDIIANGAQATVCARGTGTAVITASHPESVNDIKFYVYVAETVSNSQNEPSSSSSSASAVPVYINSENEVSLLKDGATKKLQAVLVNYQGKDTDGFRFEIDNASVAMISAQSVNGIAYIKPVGSGQAEITISHPKSESTKKVLVVVGNSEEELAGVSYLTTSSNVVAVGEGTTKSISVNIENADSVVLDGYTWTSSNPSCIGVSAVGSTAVLTGNGIGSAIITVTNRNCKYPLQIIAQCVDPIAAAANPYIQLTSSVMTLTVGNAYNSITADLVGGSESDYSDFIWTTNNPSIAVVYGQNEVGKIRAMSAGTTYITVSHPKAAYSAQILVVCDEAVKSECYISVPSSIISLKPTDSAQTISATLINGTSTDKYNFLWSLDVYDIIDFQYSANVCTITPKQTGSVTITVSHPKAAYDQQIIVNVQTYTTFAFPAEYMTVTQGDVCFVTMQVPTTNVSTYIRYYVGDPKQGKDENNILTVQGTKTTAQLTASASGTTTVTAQLVAASTNVVQATAEMMVYVKEKAVNAVYITSSSTIATVGKGKSQTLSASLSGPGVVSSDLQKLKWTTSDGNVVKVVGIGSDGSVYGESIYITAMEPGEAIITCSHEKAASDLQFYVVVPGTAKRTVSLNKSVVTLLKDASGTTIKATIENIESSEEYNGLVWTSSDTDIVRILGAKSDTGEYVGQTMTLYPVGVGEAVVRAQLPDGNSAAATVTVQANKSLVFEMTSCRVDPNPNGSKNIESKFIKYKVSPAKADINWTMAQEEVFFKYIDHKCDADGNGMVEIIGVKEGNGILAAVTDGGAKGTISVRVAWDYAFNVTGKTSLVLAPFETAEISYSVNPADAKISVESTNDDLFDSISVDNGDGTGSVIIKPTAESPDRIAIRLVATNPNLDNQVVGEKEITATFKYGDLNPKVSKIDGTGKFSSLSVDGAGNPMLTLGDGEEVTLKFEIVEKSAVGEVTNVAFKRLGTDAIGEAEVIHSESSENWKSFRIKDKSPDEEVKVYHITKAWVPTFDGKPVNNWKTDMCWYLGKHFTAYDITKGSNSYFLASNTYTKLLGDIASDTKSDAWMRVYASATGMWEHLFNNTSNHPFSNGSKCGKVLEPSLSDTEMSVNEFEHIPWFYCPGSRWSSDTWNTYYNAATNLVVPCSIDEDLWPSISNGNWVATHNYIIVGGLADFVVTDHVTAEKRTTTSKNIVDRGLIGYLTVSIEHRGKAQTPYSIPVYYEIRGCGMNQE